MTTVHLPDINAMWRAVGTINDVLGQAGIPRDHVVWRIHPAMLRRMARQSEFRSAMVPTYTGNTVTWVLFGHVAVEDVTYDYPTLAITLDVMRYYES